jgi:hypothetical protein
MYFEEGAEVIYDGTDGALIYETGSGITATIAGRGVFRHIGDSGLGQVQAINFETNTVLDIQGKELTSNEGVCIRAGSDNGGGSHTIAKFDLYLSGDGTFDNVDSDGIMDLYGHKAISGGFVLEEDGGTTNCYLLEIISTATRTVELNLGQINIYGTVMRPASGYDAVFNGTGDAHALTMTGVTIYCDNSTSVDGSYLGDYYWHELQEKFISDFVTAKNFKLDTSYIPTEAEVDGTIYWDNGFVLKGRIRQRVQDVNAPGATTQTIASNTTDIYTLRALNGATTFGVPSGNPTQGQRLIIRIKDNGTPRALTWNGIFRPIGVTLPTTTVASKTHYIECMYNSTDTKWDILMVSVEA